MDIWDEKIAENHQGKSSKFLKALERSCNDREFCYFVSYDQNNEIISCCLVTVSEIEGTIFLPAGLSNWITKIRKILPRWLIFRIVMTGALETTGRHWWYNTDRLTWDEYTKMLIEQICKYFYNSHVIIFRDFFTDCIPLPNEISFPLKRKGFREVANFPLAIIRLTHSTEENYLKSLKERDRATIRKTWRIIKNHGLLIEYVNDFGVLVDEMYPLYLAVNKNAKEMKTPPLPKEFFKILNEELPDISNVITIRDKNNSMIGFILSLDNPEIANPFFIGMDYKVARQFYLFYISIWLVICRAIKRKQSIIDLGVTNYFIKQGLGALLQPIKMFVRFRNPILNKLLKPLIPVIFQPQQPSVRSPNKKLKSESL